MLSFPGVLTPSECFSAINSGADALKIFPAFKLGIDGFKAMKAVLPSDVKTYGVGGINENDFHEWLLAGLTGFGIGSNLFHPSMNDGDIKTTAKKFVIKYDSWFAQR